MKVSNIKTKHITREERIGKRLLLDGSFSEREGVFELNITSGRNDVSRLERKLGIEFHRERERTQDGLGHYYRYCVLNKSQAYKLLTYLNQKAISRNDEPFSADETQTILAKYQGEI